MKFKNDLMIDVQVLCMGIHHPVYAGKTHTSQRLVEKLLIG